MLKMNIIERYIGKTVLASISVTLATLVGISTLFRFIDQISHVGKGDFSFITAALFSLYLVPQDIESFFPMAALIGGLVGLGAMAQSSELVVMQAIGMSKTNVVNAVLKSSIALILLMMVFSEWGVPQSIRNAKELKTQAISSGEIYSNAQGVWAKDGNAFINIRQIADNGELSGVSIYEFDQELRLTKQINANSAQFTSEQWTLEGVKIAYWAPRKITNVNLDVMPWPTSLSPDKLGVVKVKPERMPITELYEYLQYLRNNDQNANRYELAFWRKIFQPFNVAVMLLLALSFIFGPLRSVTMGARVILGILTGFSFFLFDRIFGSMSLVYQVPAVLGAFAPTLVFSLIAMRLLTKKQK
ncbi:MAG: LPS export ABC transporter permease LptG [Gammaproteobacteria bacterium]|nr:LPS export ABC transporter permease LptG [Gammaproteobacteria bacterium]